MDEPKDLGIKIGTPKQVIWTAVKKNSEEKLLSMEVEKELLEQNLTLADKRIAEEEKK